MARQSHPLGYVLVEMITLAVDPHDRARVVGDFLARYVARRPPHPPPDGEPPSYSRNLSNRVDVLQTKHNKSSVQFAQLNAILKTGGGGRKRVRAGGGGRCGACRVSVGCRVGGGAARGGGGLGDGATGERGRGPGRGTGGGGVGGERNGWASGWGGGAGLYRGGVGMARGRGGERGA